MVSLTYEVSVDLRTIGIGRMTDHLQGMEIRVPALRARLGERFEVEYYVLRKPHLCRIRLLGPSMVGAIGLIRWMDLASRQRNRWLVRVQSWE